MIKTLRRTAINHNVTCCLTYFCVLKVAIALLFGLSFSLPLFADSSMTSNNKLPRCATSPNCVSSQADPLDRRHFIQPFTVIGAHEQAWLQFVQHLKNQPRTQLINESATAVHVSATTPILRFVDDVHAMLDAEAQVIHIYSASRVGYSDLGTNRQRLEQLRKQLKGIGLID